MMPTAKAHADLLAVLHRYFEGLYHADSRLLADVFHPEARYVNMTPGDHMNYALDDYFDIVDRRVSPSSQGEIRNEAILSLEFGEAHMAFVKARMTMMGRDYLDFLTLTFDDKGWRIMAKIFTYKMQKKAG